MSKIKTARGRIVDLELEQMLTQIRNTPKTKEVVEREKYVSERMRPRRSRKPNLPKQEIEEMEDGGVVETPKQDEDKEKSAPKPKAKATPRKRVTAAKKEEVGKEDVEKEDEDGGKNE